MGDTQMFRASAESSVNRRHGKGAMADDTWEE